MKKANQKRFLRALVVCIGLCAATASKAHLMKAQHGTLNFKDDGVYMVLSLPASVFTAADENNDKLLSSDEFSKNRVDITKMIQQSITLGTDKKRRFLQGIMLNPETPHDSPNSPAPNIVVLGKFLPIETQSQLDFNIDIYANNLALPSIEITASRKSEGLSQVIEISAAHPAATLNIQ